MGSIPYELMQKMIGLMLSPAKQAITWDQLDISTLLAGLSTEEKEEFTKAIVQNQIDLISASLALKINAGLVSSVTTQINDMFIDGATCAGGTLYISVSDLSVIMSSLPVPQQ